MEVIGKLNPEIYEQEFGKLQTDEVVLTDERRIHVAIRHPQDVMFFEKYGSETVTNPDIVMVDGKNAKTVFLVKGLHETNLNVIVRLALETENKALKNSIMTFHRVRETFLNKMLIKK